MIEAVAWSSLMRVPTAVQIAPAAAAATAWAPHALAREARRRRAGVNVEVVVLQRSAGQPHAAQRQQRGQRRAHRDGRGGMGEGPRALALVQASNIKWQARDKVLLF